MELFEDALERVRRRYLFVVAGYVVMPEHVHLLVNEPRRALLSKAIQALKLSVSVRSQEKPFWQAHYYDFNISTHDKFVEKLRYIHRNPVRRGLVQNRRIGSGRAFALSNGHARNRRDRIGVDSHAERLAATRVDARSRARCLGIPGPQRRGIGGTLNWIQSNLRSGPPAYPRGCAIAGPMPRHPRSPTARDRGHPQLDTIEPKIGATSQFPQFQLTLTCSLST